MKSSHKNTEEKKRVESFIDGLKLNSSTSTSTSTSISTSTSTSSSNTHKEYLGMDIPEDYFMNSKQSILDIVSREKTRPYRTERSGVEETPVFYLRRSFQVAASITLLIILSISFFLNKPVTENIELASDDTLIESLFVEDTNMNQFLEDVLVSEIVVEAEKSEQNLENVFMNSLFVEDSLLDNYTKESVIDNIIL